MTSLEYARKFLQYNHLGFAGTQRKHHAFRNTAFVPNLRRLTIPPTRRNSPLRRQLFESLPQDRPRVKWDFLCRFRPEIETTGTGAYNAPLPVSGIGRGTV